jgi:single-strand DNA-binding protein
MDSINKWIGVGRLGREIELKKTQNGTSVISFTLACDRSYSKGSGDARHTETDWIDCQAWKSTAEYLERYAHKGDRLAVEGHLQKRLYKDREARTVYVTEAVVEKVVLLSSSYSLTSSSKEDSRPVMNQIEDSKQDDYAASSSLDISSDDLPF